MTSGIPPIAQAPLEDAVPPDRPDEDGDGGPEVGAGCKLRKTRWKPRKFERRWRTKGAQRADPTGSAFR